MSCFSTKEAVVLQWLCAEAYILTQGRRQSRSHQNLAITQGGNPVLTQDGGQAPGRNAQRAVTPGRMMRRAVYSYQDVHTYHTQRPFGKVLHGLRSLATMLHLTHGGSVYFCDLHLHHSRKLHLTSGRKLQL